LRQGSLWLIASVPAYSTPGISRCKTPLNPAHPMKSHTRSVVSLQPCDIILDDFSQTLLVLHAMVRMKVGHLLYWDIHQSCICLQIGSGVCVVPTVCRDDQPGVLWAQSNDPGLWECFQN